MSSINILLRNLSNVVEIHNIFKIQITFRKVTLLLGQVLIQKLITQLRDINLSNEGIMDYRDQVGLLLKQVRLIRPYVSIMIPSPTITKECSCSFS